MQNVFNSVSFTNTGVKFDVVVIKHRPKHMNDIRWNKISVLNFGMQRSYLHSFKEW